MSRDWALWSMEGCQEFKPCRGTHTLLAPLAPVRGAELLVRLQPSATWNNKLLRLSAAGEEADLCCSCQLQEEV